MAFGVALGLMNWSFYGSLAHLPLGVAVTVEFLGPLVLTTVLSRRLIDFASGLAYGLAGQMEKVANQVYLLTPANVEVSAEDRRRIGDRGHD